MKKAQFNRNLVCLTAFLIAWVAIPHNSLAEWDTYQANESHNGYLPGSVPTVNPKVLWSATIPQGGLEDLAIGDGNVYVTTAGSNTVPSAYALNAATGSIVWSKITGSAVSVSAPAYSNGFVYVESVNPTANTGVWTLNATTGATQFITPLIAQAGTYPAPTIFSGNLYIEGGLEGGMYSISDSTGGQNWLGTVPGYDGWTPTVTSNYCYAFTGSGNITPITGKFTILSRTTGATLSITTDTGFVWGTNTMNESPALGDNNDAFVTNDGRLLDFGTTSSGGILSIKTDHYSGQPSIANGVVYVDDGPSVVALSETTESKIWSWTPDDGHGLFGRTVVTDNLLFTSTFFDLYAVSLSTGKTVWSLPISAEGQLALSDNVLYDSATSGVVTAIALPEPASCITVVALAALSTRRRSPTLPATYRRKKCVSH